MNSRQKLDALASFWVLCAALMGLVEGIYHLLGSRPPVDFPGASGPNLLAYLALYLCTVGLPMLVSLILLRRLPLRPAAAVLSFAALLPTIFVLADHQARWRFWPELIQWNPPAHYLRAGFLAVGLAFVAALAIAFLVDLIPENRWPRTPRVLLRLPVVAAAILWLSLPSVEPSARNVSHRTCR